MDEKLQALYDTLVKDGYELPDFNTFSQKMGNPQDSQKVYDTLVKDGYELPASFEEFQNVIKPAPEQAGFFRSLGKTVQSGIADQVPIAVEQAGEVVQSALQPANVNEYITGRASTDFQRYVRERDPKFKGLAGFLTPFDIEEHLPKYGNQFMIDQGLTGQVAKMEERLPETIARRQDLEKFVQEQKAEAAAKTAGVTQDIREVKDLSSALSVAGNFVGQALYQLPLSFFTKGGSSFLMESATIYDQQLDELAAKNGISRQEVIDQNLDSPTLNQIYGTLAASMDAASAGSILGAMRQGAKRGLAKQAVKNILGEASTEGIQGNIERFAAKDAAGVEFDPLTSENLWSTANEAIAGALGGGVFSAPNLVTRQAQVADKAIAEASTGDPAIDAQIDQSAAPTPEEQQIIKESAINQNISENAIQEQSTAEVPVREQPESSPEIRQENLESNLQELTPKESVSLQAPASEVEIAPEQTPAYREALARVTELQNAFAAADPQADVADLYGRLVSAKQALVQIAPPPKPKSKSGIKSQIETTTGITPQAPISMSPQAALKHQIQTLYRGMKEGVKRGEQGTKDLVDKVTEAIKAAPLQPRQISGILGRLKRTNLSTPGSISNLTTYIDKVSEDAEYSAKLDKADKIRSQAKNKSKNKKAGAERGVLKTFSRIDPALVPDIDEYLEVGNYINEKDVVNMNVMGISARDIARKMYANELRTPAPESYTADEILDAIGEEKSKRRSDERIADLADELGIDFDQAALIYDSESVNNAARQRTLLIADTKANKIEPSDEYSSAEARIVAYLNNIDPEKLSNEQLRDLNRVIDRINENQDFSGAGKFEAIAKAQVGLEELKTRLANAKVLNLNAFEEYVSASLPQAFEAIYGLPTEAALFQQYSGVKQVSDAKALAIKEAESFVEYVNDLHRKFTELYGKSKNGFSDESQFRQGVYTELLRRAENVDPQEAFEINKNAIEQSIKTYRQVGQEEEAKTLEKLYLPFVEATTPAQAEKIMEEVDPAGKKVAEAITRWYDRYVDRIADYSSIYYNKPITRVDNYAGGRKWLKISSDGKIEPDAIETIDSINFRQLQKPRQAAAAREFRNSVRKDAVLDFNLHKKAADQIQDMVFRIEAIPAMLQVREFSSRKQDVLDLFGAGASAESKRKAERLYSSIFDKNRGLYYAFEKDSIGNGNDKSNAERLTESLLGTLRKIGYTMTLSGFTQIPKQATVLSNVAINLGSDAALLPRAIGEAFTQKEAFKEFLKGETVSTRAESQSLFNLGNFYSASNTLETESRIKRFFSDSLPRYIQRRFDSSWSGIKPLTKTDSNVAQMSYLAFYKQYLKRQNTKYQGLQRENKLREDKVRQEARAYAKQRVDNLQVASNPAELSRALKTKSIASQFVKAYLVPYGTFSTSTKQRLFSDWRAILTGNSKQRAAGIRDVMATMVESIAFTAVNVGIKLGLYGAIALALRSLFNLDDEEDKEQTMQRMAQQIAKDLTLSNLPVVLTAPGEELSAQAINEASYQLYKLTEEPEITREQWSAEVGQPMPEPPKNNSNMVGPYGVPIQRAAEAFEYAGAAEDEDLTREQQLLAATVLALQMGQMAGYVPSDLKNAVSAEFRKQKKAAKSNTAPTSEPARDTQRPQRRPRPNRPRI